MRKEFIRKELVRFQHCDLAGIVFYPRYFIMLNDLVEDWFRDELGLSFKAMHPNHGVPSVNIKADFRNPSRIGDVLSKSLYVTKLGSKSVVYNFKFINEKDQVILEGEGTLVNIEKKPDDSLKSVAWSENVRKNLERFLH